MKTRFCTVICVMLSVIMTVGVFFSSCEKKPADKTMTAAEYLEKISEKNFSAEYESVNTRTDITVKPTADIPLPFDSLSLTEYVGTSGESAVFVNTILEGNPLDISLYVGGENAVIGSSLMGDTTIGLRYDDIGSFLEGLLGSYLGDAAPYDYDEYYGDWEEDYYFDDPFASAGMSEEDLFAILSLLSSAEMTEAASKLAAYAEDYVSFLSDSIDKASNSDVKDANGKITVTTEFNTDSAKKIVKDLYNKLKNDSKLKSFIAETVAPIAGIEESEILAQIESLFEGDELYDELLAAFDENKFSLKTEVKAKSDYTLLGIETSLTFEGLGKVSFKFDLEDENDVKIAYLIESYDEMSNSYYADMRLGMSFKTAVSGDVTVYSVSYDMMVSEDDTDMSATLFTYAYNEKSGEFTLSVMPEDEYESVSFVGTLLTEDNKATCAVNKIEAAGAPIAVDVTCVIETNAELPKFPTDFKNVFELTEEDLAALTASIEADPLFPVLVSLFEQLGGFEDDPFEDQWPEYDWSEDDWTEDDWYDDWSEDDWY